MILRNKKILLGVCGSIAAYKVAHLVRLLVKQEAEVKVVMTTSASDFISPLTLATLSKNPVDTQFIKNDRGEWVNHVALALWADHIVIAPATANTLAKLANGLCDNLLCAVVLSARCPISIAPAMDLDMLAHHATQKNLSCLKSFGYDIIECGIGELASGLSGAGRMAEPEEIVSHLEHQLAPTFSFSGKKILITAGPTQEAIDPVRFISNHSTGKMGYAIAEAAAKAGAEVTLVSGPVNLIAHHRNIKVVHVKSAAEMYAATKVHFQTMDVLILSAAVADYRPIEVALEKLKKADDKLTLELAKTTDIAHELGAIKAPHQLLVGFALETNNELANATAKLSKKNLDLIVLNTLKDSGAGFGTDTNKITILDNAGSTMVYELKDKKLVAIDILEQIHLRLKTK